MSLQAEPIFDVPELTAQVALAAFPKGNIYLQLRDELGTIYEDEQFAELYAHDGQPAISPWRLALVTVVQFAENLPDRQAADAVRSRIDLKYLLGLELTDPGFDYSVLCEFRARLVAGDVVSLLLDHLLEMLKAKGLLKSSGKQRTDSTHILAAMRDLSRLELVGKTLLHALNNLAVVTPQWLKDVVPADWLERYNVRWEEYHLPKTKAKRHELGAQVGQDGLFLLRAIYAAGTPSWLREIPAIETLRQVWIQIFYEENGQLHWRLAGNIPPVAKSICSPFDTQARYNIKRETEWVGYKVHLTETCGTEEPHLITHVVTTAATEQDTEVVDDLHTALAEKELTPDEHLVDMGYSDSYSLVNAYQKYGIEMVVPMRADHSWQQRAGQGYDLYHFHIDWEAEQATCPQGQTSASWVSGSDTKGNPRIEVMFNTSVCAPCQARPLCTKSKRKRRKITIRPQKEASLLQTVRAAQQTEAFWERYATRAGVEGTISQAVIALNMRRSRYRGLAKTHLQHVATAVAINIKRLDNWWNGHPFSKTQSSRFALLMAT